MSTGLLVGEPAGLDCPEAVRTPLADLLDAELPARARWAVPGHMGGRCAPQRALDLLGGGVHNADLWPDQSRFAAALTAAEDLAARAWGAGSAHLLTGGATSGNLAWIFASLRDGDTVVVDSACHVSVLAGLRLRCGVRPVWVQRQLDPQTQLPLPLDPRLVARALAEHPAARQVIVTSPTYSGTGSRLRPIARAASAAGAVLYVDAAWAPHGRWVPGGELDPLAAGAHACVVSLHKTGAALSGAGVLLTSTGLDDDLLARLATDVEALRSTSPLLPVLVSADLARAELAGGEGLGPALNLARDLRRRCASVPAVRVLPAAELDGHGAGTADPLKLVLDVRATGLTGFAVQRRLREAGVIVEGADLARLYLVLPATVREPSRHIAAHTRLVTALADLVADALGEPRRSRRAPRLSPSVWASARGEQVMIPSQAAAGAVERVPLELAVGRVAGEHAAPYPPGVPVWVPGERVTAQAVDIVRQVRAAGGQVHGLADPGAASVAVVASRTSAGGRSAPFRDAISTPSRTG